MTDNTPSPDLRNLGPLIEAAAEAAIQRSLVQTIVPIYRHGSVTAVDTANWIHQVQMDGDTVSILVHDRTAGGAFIGARVTVLFAPPHQAMVVAADRRQIGYRPWQLVWTTPGNQPSLGNGTWLAEYQRRGQDCDVKGSLVFGSTTGGGTLGWSFGLPFPASTDVGEQIFLVKAFTTGGANWMGFAFVASGGQTAVPHFPFNSGVSFLGQAQNADGTGGFGTGIPAIAGQFTWTSGTNFIISGNYKVRP